MILKAREPGQLIGELGAIGRGAIDGVAVGRIE